MSDQGSLYSLDLALRASVTVRASSAAEAVRIASSIDAEPLALPGPFVSGEVSWWPGGELAVLGLNRPRVHAADGARLTRRPPWWRRGSALAFAASSLGCMIASAILPGAYGIGAAVAAVLLAYALLDAAR